MEHKPRIDDYLRSQAKRLKLAIGKHGDESTGWRAERLSELYLKSDAARPLLAW